MGQQHNELRNGVFSRALTKAVGDTRHGGVERYGETLQPVIDLWSRPEFEKLRGEHLVAFRTFQSAVALEFGGIALTNPIGSGAILTIEAVHFRTDTATGASALLETGPTTLISGTYLISAVPGARRDRRFEPGAFGLPGAAVLLQGSDLTNTFGIQHEQNANQGANVPATEFMTPPFVIKPGDGIWVIEQTVNQTLHVTWKYRERTAFPGELG